MAAWLEDRGGSFAAFPLSNSTFNFYSVTICFLFSIHLCFVFFAFLFLYWVKLFDDKKKKKKLRLNWNWLITQHTRPTGATATALRVRFRSCSTATGTTTAQWWGGTILFRGAPRLLITMKTESTDSATGTDTISSLWRLMNLVTWLAWTILPTRGRWCIRRK